MRVKYCVQQFKSDFSVTSSAFSENSEQVFTGGIDNEIKVWDLRKDALYMKLEGHTDTVTGV